MTTSAILESQEEVLAPVIYELGKALYIAQQFEIGLLLLVALLHHHGGKINKDTFLESLEKYPSRTLGQLAKAFGKLLLPLPESFQSFLKEGVDVRNSIAHDFVLSNTVKFRTSVGREEIIDELRDLQYKLEQCRLFTDNALDQCLNVFGGSLEQLRNGAESVFYADLLSQVTRH